MHLNKLSRFHSPFLVAFSFAAFAYPADKPNVVFVITDDQGYGDISAHGNPILETPATDVLYAESVRLTDYHVTPCLLYTSPSPRD